MVSPPRKGKWCDKKTIKRHFHDQALRQFRGHFNSVFDNDVKVSPGWNAALSLAASKTQGKQMPCLLAAWDCEPRSRRAEHLRTGAAKSRQTAILLSVMRPGFYN
jgi:hypothetical protein